MPKRKSSRLSKRKNLSPPKVNLRVETRKRAGVHRTRLKRMARHAFDAEHASGEITLVLVNDARMRELNRAFHATNSATDVLTFPFDDAEYHGDIVISYDTAHANARAARWDLADELDLLVVHGILHLLGYDDTNKKTRAKMWKRQAEILGREVPLSAS